MTRDTYSRPLNGRQLTIAAKMDYSWFFGFGDEANVATESSESALARLHILVRTGPDRVVAANVERIEARIVETLRTWEDRLRDALQSRLAEDPTDELARHFEGAFPVSYQEDVPAAQAIPDLLELRALPSTPDALGLALHSGDDGAGILHLRLYRRGEPIAMSDLLPLLENFDLRILNERPYRIATRDGGALWIQDLEVAHPGGRPLDAEQSGGRFEAAFFAVWERRAEDDGFNRLVLAGGLDWPAIAASLASGNELPCAVKDGQDFTYVQSLKAAFRPGMGQYLPDRFFLAQETPVQGSA